jgi:hypothetical protein
VTEQHKKELDRHFAWFESKLPPKLARFVAWLRKPSSRLARIPLAILLVVGGVVDVAIRTGFGCAGCAGLAKADVAGAWMDRAQMGRADGTQRLKIMN